MISINQRQLSRFFLYVFLIQSGYIQAQFQSIFGNQYTEWNYITGLCDATWINTYTSASDTIISDSTYKMVDGLGYLRENSDNTKVWYKEEPTNTDILILDMTLNQGDTFSILNTELIVDTVFFENNAKTIQFNKIVRNCISPDGIGMPLRFIEGMGPNHDFAFLINGLSDLYINIIRCHTKDTTTQILMTILEDEDCRNAFGTNLDEDKERRVDHIPYPNPVNDFLQLGHIPYERYTLYDLTGTKVRSGNYQSQINMASMQRGILFRING